MDTVPGSSLASSNRIPEKWAHADSRYWSIVGGREERERDSLAEEANYPWSPRAHPYYKPCAGTRKGARLHRVQLGFLFDLSPLLSSSAEMGTGLLAPTLMLALAVFVTMAGSLRGDLGEDVPAAPTPLAARERPQAAVRDPRGKVRTQGKAVDRVKKSQPSKKAKAPKPE
ncbi:hypothetical protein NDU88_005597 [Pleurodeles waltl]|uniref:Uncharacterized protein n=1 Tax=Pleurodeles waltl TaxID=8319 RepID=A0AAV7N6C0_PLEWA|nr:hypothetical protein NDU88_005597 [Pleurodeles waltl]